MNLNLPKVSIITPSFNQGQFIEATIQSVLNQTYPNIEYIVVDGGSTDQTMSVVNYYKSQIDIVIHEKDKGQSDAINKGFKLATGELVGWLNSDDVLYPDCVAEIVKLYQEKPDGSIYYIPLQNGINATGKVHNLATRKIPDKKYLLNEDFSIIQPSSFYTRKHVIEVGFLDAKIHYCMDLDLWLRLLNLAPIYYSAVGVPLSGFRNWELSKTTTGADKFLKEIKKTLLKHGASIYSRNIRRIQIELFKVKIKRFLRYNHAGKSVLS
ncbi:glycosyltransferase family 2 protein [Spirosoma endophyticum]|uniref:Glycosyltransferase involved in cell wall bisynthesis n=1 Tax=Spirosoma endophyticum TaxID=662367 RepID=A0A1I1PUX9_9BACT|nr:glycosyltransferase family 2 protein [Spirosoma endophyticum]SFD13472.1 Glycosyltransferase involved in cell wall bisynthesis [Spirosoma endophyticum]